MRSSTDGARKPDLLAEARERRPTVVLQQSEDADVDVVQRGVCVVSESHKVPPVGEHPFIRVLRAVSMVH